MDVEKVVDVASIVASSPQAVATKARDRMRLVGSVRETMGTDFQSTEGKGLRYSYQKVERDRS
jgi:hypothetical protein